MILAVCLNPAVDVTYAVDELRPGASHRVSDVQRHPGGKAVNVARVLTQEGADATLLAFAGGAHGAELEHGLAAARVGHVLVPVAGNTRSTVTVVSGDDTATVLNEPGPEIAGAEWAALLTAFDALLAGARAVVLSGSLPTDLTRDAYAQLVSRARQRGVPSIVDAEGEALSAALGAGPTVAKPNAAEVAALVGRPVDDDEAALQACRALIANGAGAALVSRGAEGLAAVLDGRSWTARLPVPMRGNPTGAGDALTAGLARGLVAGAEPADLLADAAALAAAAVAATGAGTVVTGLAAALRTDIVVKEH